MDFITELALSAVRGWLNSYLKKLTPQQVKKAIENNQNLWSVTPHEMLTKGKNFKNIWGRLYNKYYDMITTELILGWIHKDHPQLWEEIMWYPNGIGYFWFDAQVEKIKQQIREL